MKSIEQINADPEIMRGYTPGHKLTENYIVGMEALKENRLKEAFEALEAEPPNSPCFGLARGNCGLILLQIGRYKQAEQYSSEALEHLDRHNHPHPPSCAQFARNFAESISKQGRQIEAIRLFNSSVHYGRGLMESYPDFANDLEIESAHAFNSWGGILLEIGNLDASIGCLRKALDIYRKHEHFNKVGMGQALTNYGLSLMEIGRSTDAWLALREALDWTKNSNDQNQIRRIQIAIIRLDPSQLSDVDPYTLLEEAAAESERQGRYSTAYVRRCIKATLAVDRGELDIGKEAVAEANRIESLLDKTDPNPARLRLCEAQLLEKSGESSDAVLKVLIEGARLWFERLNRPHIQDDIRVITQIMHSHFRFLSRKLLDKGRLDEALAAFEAGRALAYTIEVDQSAMDRIIHSNHLEGSLNSIDCSYLRSVQAGLAPNEITVVVALLPPELTAFIIKNESVSVVSKLLPSNDGLVNRLFDEIRDIPNKLGKAEGESAVPQYLRDFSLDLVKAIKTFAVVSVLPNSLLHNVPWRALLHHAGLPWAQLSFTTGFGLLLHSAQYVEVQNVCTALGNGVAGTVDLNTEAADFANAFGADGKIVRNCTSKDVELALCHDQIVLLSCHGTIKKELYTEQQKLFFELSDGNKPADEIFPDQIRSGLVVLSACHSGVYEVTWGDYPVGAAPQLIKAGAKYCVCARYPVGARFAAAFMNQFGLSLASGIGVGPAFAKCLEEMQVKGFDLWNDLACFELMR